MKKWLSLFLTLTMICGGISFTGVALATDTTVTFASDALYVAVGKTASAKASVKPYAATKKGLSYQTSDESIATVSSKGVVTGVAVGECQLTATSKLDTAVSQSIPVKVIQPVEDMDITSESSTVFVGETLALSIAYKPADATLQNATFASSKESVATVSPEGVVTGVSRGTAKITVTSADGYATTGITVTVAQKPESVAIAPETASAAVGKKVQLKATVLPDDANDKSVTWTSADESVATVNAKGLVTIQSVGETQITATSNANAAATATVPAKGLELAKSIAFDNTLYSVLINQTVQLGVSVTPDSASDKSVTYKSKNAKIASVDENGLVTGLKGGKTVIYAYTADGSKKKASTTVEVIVPVTGVSFKYKDVRVGVGSRGSYTVAIAPSDASDKTMSWVSSDESIATVTGTTNRFTVKGRRWGRCKVTGTTEDGNFSVDVYVDVGTLRHAVTISSVSIKNGKPYLSFRNQSDMDISQVTYEILGYDLSLQPIFMSTTGDRYTLYGAYNVPLAGGESTRHGQFTFYSPSDYDGLAELQVAITGWSTSSGYYDHNGKLQYNYLISEQQQEWVTYPSGTDVDQLAR